MDFKTMAIFIISFLSLFSWTQCEQTSCPHIEVPRKERIGMFKNPILASGTDPYVNLHSDNFYYWPSSEGLNIIVRKSRKLTNWTNAKTGVIFDNQETSVLYGRMLCRGVNILAPELHWVDSRWYVYFSMELQNGSRVVKGRRNYVIESLSEDPYGHYGVPQLLSPDDGDTFSAHGTILEHPNGLLYFIWSGKSHHSGESSDLYISAMDTPVKLSGERVQLREPTEPWEMMSGAGAVLEAPHLFQNGGRIFLIFSASNATDADNCLGISSIDEWKHPLVPENWDHNTMGCVFGRNDREGVYGVGRVSVTTSGDHKEPWMIYTGSAQPRGPSSIRAERFGWSPDGFPIFPSPAGLKREHIQPSVCIFDDNFAHLC